MDIVYRKTPSSSKGDLRIFCSLLLTILVNVEAVIYSTRCLKRLASEIEMNYRGGDFHLMEFSFLELNIIIKEVSIIFQVSSSP